MIDEELKKIWQGASQETLIQFNKSKLLTEMEQSLKRFDDKIKSRNEREIGIALILIPVIIAMAYFTTYTISRLGAGLIILFSFFIIFRLWYTRKQKNKIDYTTTLKQQLITHKAYIETEKKLLNSVLYWYILLFFISGILFTAGKPMSPWLLGFFIFVNILVGGHIWWLNKRAVKNEFNPLIQQIEITLEELEA